MSKGQCFTTSEAIIIPHCLFTVNKLTNKDYKLQNKILYTKLLGILYWKCLKFRILNISHANFKTNVVKYKDRSAKKWFSLKSNLKLTLYFYLFFLLRWCGGVVIRHEK